MTPRLGFSCISRTTIWPPEPAPITSTSRLGTLATARGTFDDQAHREPGARDQKQRQDEVHHLYRARQSVFERLDDGEEDDEDRAGKGNGTQDQQEVAAAHVAPPLLVEPEGAEDDQLADDDDPDRLRRRAPHNGAAGRADLRGSAAGTPGRRPARPKLRRRRPAGPGCDRRDGSGAAWDLVSLEAEVLGSQICRCRIHCSTPISDRPDRRILRQRDRKRRPRRRLRC